MTGWGSNPEELLAYFKDGYEYHRDMTEKQTDPKLKDLWQGTTELWRKMYEFQKKRMAP